MSIDPSLIKIGAYAVIAVFLLLQWFLSVRPWFIWGLVLPIMFAAAWYCVVKQPLFFDELGFTPDSVEMMSHFCKLGVLASLAVFMVCRIFRLIRRMHKKRQREQRLEAKRKRQLEEYLSATQMALNEAGLDATQALPSDLADYLPGGAKGSKIN